MIGKIIDIHEDIATIKLSIDITNQANLINIHVIFEDNSVNQKIVGEIRNISTDKATIGIVGEIKENKFTSGYSVKPSFKSVVRIITMDELQLILGNQGNTGGEQIYLGYSTVYNNCKINVGVNDFFSNHFAILGNTGSGKSFTVSRIIQNIFTSNEYLPVNANILIFDAYGEYKTAFSRLHQISPMLNTKSYTTNTKSPDGAILRIPLWLLSTDDIAILLEAEQPSQLSIIEKALKLVPIIKGTDESAIAYCNDIIARAIIDILKSGKDSIKVSDQIKAILSTVNTPTLNLESIISQPGYNRPLKQCLYVDNMGKMLEMELVTNFISGFLIDDLALPEQRNDITYNLEDLEKALEFSLISEGILKSDKVYDYANILSVRLHSLINSDYAVFFNYDELVDRNGYITQLLTTEDGQKAQIINFNINYVNNRMAKSIVKIISKLVFDYCAESDNRGGFPFHIILEEAHRYVQDDIDKKLLGYNIFDTITKEGRKYGVLLGMITQRPSELSETSISQCSNFLVLRTLHPLDLKYIREMVPNVTDEIMSSIKVLQPGNAIGFGNAFKLPVCIKIEKPNPEPLSNNCNVARIWYAKNRN